MSTTSYLTRPANFRDLGGHRTPAGAIRPGLVFRSDDLSTADPGFADELTSQGVGHVIDLRSGEEAALTGRGPLARTRITYHHAPLTAGLAPPPPPGPRAPAEMGDSYACLLEHAAGQVAFALGVIAATRGAVAFHCAAGKDRTGILAAVLLSALAVGHAAIIADYARTEPAMAGINRRLAPVNAAAGRGGAPVPQGPRAPAGAMAAFLAALHRRHGDVLAPVRRAGLDDRTLARLRSRLVS